MCSDFLRHFQKFGKQKTRCSFSYLPYLTTENIFRVANQHDDIWWEKEKKHDESSFFFFDEKTHTHTHRERKLSIYTTLARVGKFDVKLYHPVFSSSDFSKRTIPFKLGGDFGNVLCVEIDDEVLIVDFGNVLKVDVLDGS